MTSAVSSPVPPSTAELRELATSVASEAAVLVMDQLDSAYDMDTKSSSTDVVTAVDRAAEELIVERIRTARPDDGLIGEEGTGVDGTSGYSWLIDPIDGTTNFVYGLPGFTVSVAVGLDSAAGGAGSPRGVVAGCVADPTHHDRTGQPRVFSAGRGLGASCNGRTLSVSAASDLATSLVATGFSYDPKRRARQGSSGGSRYSSLRIRGPRPLLCRRRLCRRLLRSRIELLGPRGWGTYRVRGRGRRRATSGGKRLGDDARETCASSKSPGR